MIKPHIESEFLARRKTWQESCCVHLLLVVTLCCLQKISGHSFAAGPELWLTILMSLIPAGILLLLLTQLKRQSLICLCIALLSIAFWTIARNIVTAPQQFNFEAGLTALWIAYPLWSWRLNHHRLEACTKKFIHCSESQIFKFIPETPDAGTLSNKSPQKKTTAHPSDIQFSILNAALESQQTLYQFALDCSQSLEQAMLISDHDGNLLFANQAAHNYFASLGIHQPENALLPYLFSAMQAVTEFPADISWWDLCSARQDGSLTLEVRDNHGVLLAIRSKAFFFEAQKHAGNLVYLHNISAFSQAKQSSADCIKILSCRLRTPLISLLALLETHKIEFETAENPLKSKQMQDFSSKIEINAQNMLLLLDTFCSLMQVRNMQSISPDNARVEIQPLEDLLQLACDALWEPARLKNIRINYSHHDDKHDAMTANYPTELPSRTVPVVGNSSVLVDAETILMALQELIRHCITHSLPNQSIDCQYLYSAETQEIDLTIHAPGYEMSYTEQSRYFQEYVQQQLDTIEQSHLSILLIKCIIQKNHGLFDFHSNSGQGSLFKIKFKAYELKKTY